jgi:LPXTG-motif cell wall-anchored protein
MGNKNFIMIGLTVAIIFGGLYLYKKSQQEVLKKDFNF